MTHPPLGAAAPSCNCVRAHMPKPERSVVMVGTAQAALSCGVYPHGSYQEGKQPTSQADMTSS